MRKPKAVDYRTKEQKRADFQDAVKTKWDNFAGWVRDNNDVLILTVPVVVSAITGVSKITSKAIANQTVEKEIKYKERTIYDHSLGRYVELKRPLTAAQSLTIEERRAGGERLHVILDDMGLLKR